VAFADFDPTFQTERVILLAETSLPHASDRSLVTDIRQRILAKLQIANFEVHLIEPGWLIKSSSGKVSRSLNRERWRSGEASAKADRRRP
jgi:hypothetical protein